MQAITTIKSTFVPLPVENIDTDQISPARFLKATTKVGFGKNLFRDWRYEADDETKPKADFVLNQPQYRGEILVVSRRAQLPRVHAMTQPLAVSVADIPLGAPVSRLHSVDLPALV